MPYNRYTALFCGAALCAISASHASAADVAQGDTKTASDAQAAEQVVVTGSRLGPSGFTAPTPVTVINAQLIEQRAPANVADVINEQPSFRVSQSDTTRNNGGNGGFPNSGQNLLDLRALGPGRTLTLINGHRAVGTNWNGTVDSNIVPVGLVQRIDVVTGGASAAYGSDAVAGVVNIILRDKMQGVTLSAQGGLTEHGNGTQYSADLAGGTDFADGRGEIIAGIDVNHLSQISDVYGQKWGAAEIGTIQPSVAQRTALGLPQNVITTNVEPGTSAPGGLLYQGTVGGKAYTFDASGNPVAFNQGTLWGTQQFMTGSTANSGFNTGNVAPLRNSSSREDFYSRASYDLTDSINAFVEVNYSHATIGPYKASDVIVGTGVGGTFSPIQISRTNPFVTPAILALVAPGTAPFTIGRIMTEYGGQFTSQAIDTGRIVAGLKGDLFGDWKWEAYVQSGQTRLDFERNDLNANALQRAVNGCADTTTGLNAQQRSDLATYESISGLTCTPFNPFGVGRNPISATTYFNWHTRQIETLQQNVVSGSISGSPFALPAGPVQVAAGGEYRRESINADSDPVSERGTLLTNNLVQFAGKYNVTEGFVELGVPLLKDLPLIESLDMDTAARRTDYSLSGVVTTWKAGLNWQLTDALRARFTRSHDIRAPNLFEIFLVGGQGSATAINRIPNGVIGRNGSVNVNPLGIANTASQPIVQVGSGGGSALKPEIGDTTTGGLVFQQGEFRASVDYYRINLAGQITRPSNQQEIDLCRDGAVAHCQNIIFDSTVPGGIQLVEARSTNLNVQTVSGYDVEAEYREPDLFGSGGDLTLRGLANYVEHNRTFNVLTTLTQEDANQVNSQPKLGYNLTVGYNWGRYDFNVQFRGFTARRGNPSIYNLDGSLSANTVLGPEDPGYVVTNNNTTTQNRFPGQMTINPSITFQMNDRISIFANINNLFDVGPPPNSTSNIYDLIGRRFTIGFRASAW